jgi:hypothetical protein
MAKDMAAIKKHHMMQSDYNVETASRETKEAMNDRCQTQGHEFDNCCSMFFRVYQRCKWCGEER